MLRSVQHLTAVFMATIATLLLAAQSVAQTEDKLTPKQIFESYHDSVVKIETNDGTGTGFFFKDGGLVATCYHVIKGASKISVTSVNGSTWSVSSVYTNEKSDAAILKLTEATTRKPIPTGEPDKLSPGDDLCIIGNPLGFLDLTLTTGIVSAKRKMEGVDVIQTSAAISSGSSGSPVIATNGKVIGFASFHYDGNSLDFAVSVKELLAVLEKPSTPVEEFYKSASANANVNPSDLKVNSKPKTATEKDIAEANKLCGKWMSAIARSVYDWKFKVYVNAASDDRGGKDLAKRGEKHSLKIRDALMTGKLFIAKVDDYGLWDQATCDTLKKDVETLYYACNSVIEKEGDFTKATKLSNKEYEDALDELLTSLTELQDSYQALYDLFEAKKWFDPAAVQQYMTPAVMYSAFSPSLKAFYPDFDDEGHCTISYGRDVKPKSVILAIRRNSNSEFVAVKDWGQLQDQLYEWKEVKTVTIRYRESGKTKTMDVEVIHGKD